MAIIGDIAQAFLQLKLDRRDRDLTRFFWYNITQVEGKYEMTSDVTIYRFTRLPFGLTCSPFLLSATLRELAHLHKSTFPNAADLIDNSTFMDDFAAGGENDNQVISLYYELTGLINVFSLPMAKWATNSEQLRCIWEAKGREIETDTQVLGGRWDTSSDTFYIDHHDITETLLEGSASKRQLLHVTSRFYNILGLFTPISITGKLLFQDMWCRGNRKYIGELTATELRNSRTYWIQVVQKHCFPAELQALQNRLPLPKESKIVRFNPFMEDGLIHLGDRLQFAELSREWRQPLLLNGLHPSVQLLIRETHIRLHHLGVRIVLSELRSEFWILRTRQAVKKILRTCLPCKMAHNHLGQAIEAPLPGDRVTPMEPFEVTGIDFAGPLYIKVVGGTHKKCYIALFTCATTRAMHLELCSDMSTDTFLLALQRFAGKRGLPHTIYTDNARSFHAANKELASISATSTHQYLAKHNIHWKFIEPKAAWLGGWWERMVGTTKRCLRKVLGKTQISEEASQHRSRHKFQAHLAGHRQ
ncbi:hypothetical protein ANN_24689 [Periplaneta americana]|uniref:Integrase catalytic domain-containing protein n=1 Tax=Periplaneta americana TaxID=6978 RepID=A0ABQ8RZB5_PERAM|nr:hypothetical protein ANN_24689 [Periplaneta americana]